MSSKLAHYSPEDVMVVIAGFVTISGFNEGTFIEIERPTKIFSERESSDGVLARNHSKSGLYRVKLSLHSASESNQILTYLSKVDELTLMGKFPMIIKDGSGSSLLFASQCWIENLPNSSFTDSISSREWTICCSGIMNVGGNESPSGVGEDILRIGGGLLGGIL